VAGELPADDHAREHVDDEREERASLPGAQVGEVPHPEAIGRLRGEVPADQVRAPLRGRVGDRGLPWLGAALGALHARRSHQTRDLVTARGLALADQLRVHAPRAVALEVLRVDLADAGGQPLVGHGPVRALPGLALMVGGRRHVQGLTDRLDAETVALDVDKRGHLVRSASSSIAKNTEAALRISFALRSW
jgi:hypothetical protein